MIKYRENRNDIIQRVEIDLTGICEQSRQDLESKVTKYLKYKGKNIFNLEAGNKLIYKTEVLIPKVNKGRLNILMVLGNPAVHSVAERMFFSYEGAEGKWREHRFWKALRDCGILKFSRDLGKPTPENIEKINACKRDWLLNGEYESKFNIFLLPYFSFPTPASRPRQYSGVPGITAIVGKEIFKEMREFEYQRFKGIVLGNDIKNVTCFQKTNVLKEIIQKAEGKPIGNILKPNYPIYKLGGSLEHVILYRAPPTKRLKIQEAKEILSSIIYDIRTKIE